MTEANKDGPDGCIMHVATLGADWPKIKADQAIEEEVYVLISTDSKKLLPAQDPKQARGKGLVTQTTARAVNVDYGHKCQHPKCQTIDSYGMLKAANGLNYCLEHYMDADAEGADAEGADAEGAEYQSGSDTDSSEGSDPNLSSEDSSSYSDGTSTDTYDEGFATLKKENDGLTETNERVFYQLNIAQMVIKITPDHLNSLRKSNAANFCDQFKADHTAVFCDHFEWYAKRMETPSDFKSFCFVSRLCHYFYLHKVAVNNAFCQSMWNVIKVHKIESSPDKETDKDSAGSAPSEIALSENGQQYNVKRLQENVSKIINLLLGQLPVTGILAVITGEHYEGILNDPTTLERENEEIQIAFLHRLRDDLKCHSVDKEEVQPTDKDIVSAVFTNQRMRMYCSSANCYGLLLTIAHELQGLMLTAPVVEDSEQELPDAMEVDKVDLLATDYHDTLENLICELIRLFQQNDEKATTSGFIVDKVLECKIKHGQELYHVTWQGYTADEATWEPLEHLEGQDAEVVNDMVAAKAALGERPHKRSKTAQ
jgi:hypothetical protein